MKITQIAAISASIIFLSPISALAGITARNGSSKTVTHGSIRSVTIVESETNSHSHEHGHSRSQKNESIWEKIKNDDGSFKELDTQISTESYLEGGNESHTTEGVWFREQKDLHTKTVETENFSGIDY